MRLIFTLTIILSLLKAAPRVLGNEQRCVSNFKPFEEGQSFIKNERHENKQQMRKFGYERALALILKYRHMVLPHQTVLELGPFYNPLGPAFGDHIRWLVWEYDTEVAMDLASETSPPERAVFNVDLNLLNKHRWKVFLKENSQRLGSTGERPKLGAAIFSSVFNYVNYRVILAKTFDMLADGGLLIIANSEIAMDVPFNNNLRASPTIGVVEHLLANYGHRIEILEGSYIDPNTGISPSQIALAIKVHKHRSNRREDQYRAAVSIYFENAPLPRAKDRDLRWNLYLASRLSKPNYELDSLRQQWHLRKEELINEFFEQRRQFFDEVRRADHYVGPFSWERFNQGKRSVRDMKFVLHEINKYELMPERRILLKSLSILDPEKRAPFLQREITELYIAQTP